jgi:hypothetical protein
MSRDICALHSDIRLPPLMGGRIGRSFMNGNGIDKMVKSITEIAQGISDYKRPSLKGRRLINSQNKTVTSAVTICLLEQAVRVSLRPGKGFILDSLYVFLAPNQLGADARKV